MNTRTTTEPKVFIQCLGCYNAGKIVGQWAPASDVELAWEDIQDYYTAQQLKTLSIGTEVDQFHACSNPEEYMIGDYEGFAGIPISEWESLEIIEEIAELIEKHGEAFAAFVSNIGLDYAKEDWTQTAEQFQEAYYGIYDTELEFAEEIFDDLYGHDLPDNIHYYIDYEKFARDLFMDDFYSREVENGLAIFRYI